MRDFSPAAVPDPARNLAAVCCYFNPCHYRSRRENYQRFVEGLAPWGVPLLTIELAFGDEPWELPDGPDLLRVRTPHVMWHKECLLNLGIRRLIEQGYRHIAWLDADVRLHGPDWPQAAGEALRRHALVQLFDTVARLRPHAPPERKRGSAAYRASTGRLDCSAATPGYAWAARAEILAQVPLYEACIVGGGDAAIFFAAFAPGRDWFRSLHAEHWFRAMNLACRRHYLAWAARWGRLVAGRVGALRQTASTFYHGSRKNRQFHQRFSRIATLDPQRDLVKGPEGCWRWKNPNTSLASAVTSYFTARAEDS